MIAIASRDLKIELLKFSNIISKSTTSNSTISWEGYSFNFSNSNSICSLIPTWEKTLINVSFVKKSRTFILFFSFKYLFYFIKIPSLFIFYILENQIIFQIWFSLFIKIQLLLILLPCTHPDCHFLPHIHL